MRRLRGVAIAVIPFLLGSGLVAALTPQNSGYALQETATKLLWNGVAIPDEELARLRPESDGTVRIPVVTDGKVDPFWRSDPNMPLTGPIEASKAVGLRVVGADASTPVLVTKAADKGVITSRHFQITPDMKVLTVRMIGNGDMSDTYLALKISIDGAGPIGWAQQAPSSVTAFEAFSVSTAKMFERASVKKVVGQFEIMDGSASRVIGLSQGVGLPSVTETRASLSLLKVSAGLNANLSLVEWLSTAMREHQIPGGLIAIGRGGSLVGLAAHGIRQSSDTSQVTAQDPFVLGSMTHFVLGMLTARLVDQGRIAWSDNMDTVFPELSGQLPEAYGRATVFDFATCASGLPGSFNYDEGYKRWQLAPRDARYSLLKEYILTLPPATVAKDVDSHGMPNWNALAALLERKTGVALEQLIKEELCVPLGIDSFGFDIPEDSRGLFGLGGNIKNTSGVIVPTKFVYRSRVSFYCNAVDLLRLCQAALPSKAGGAKLLSDDAIEALHRKNVNSPFAPGGRLIADGILYMAGDSGGEYGNVVIDTKSGKTLAGCFNLRGSSGGQDAMMLVVNKFLAK